MAARRGCLRLAQLTFDVGAGFIIKAAVKGRQGGRKRTSRVSQLNYARPMPPKLLFQVGPQA